MSLVSIQNLSLTLHETLFSHLDFDIGEGERLGIVAANGHGKTSLLRLIVGEGEPTSGAITRARGLKVGYVSQYVPENLLDVAFYEAVIGGLDQEARDYESWRADIILDDLGVAPELRELPIRRLSGGWQRLALLARAWVSEPDLLLLDEPTNHLDLEKVRLLENWLNALPRSVAVVACSHDRAFLDAVTKRTLFLRTEKSPSFALPYSQARVALDEIDAANARQFEKDMKTVQQLRRQAAKLNNIGINSGSDLLVVKTKQLEARADKIEESAKAVHVERSAGKIVLASRGSHAKALVALDETEIHAPDGRLLYKTGPLWINPGDRIVLLGANGAGKTRLLRLIREAILEPARALPSIKATPSLVLGYSDQALSELRLDWTPFETINRRFEIGDQRARSLLAGAGMTLEMQAKPVERLSGGQKARLAMLVLRLTNPNFYILDEPTNHLDIDGQEALEVELLCNEAASLIVSHDRSFVRNVGNRFWLIERKRLVEIESPDAFFASIGGADGR
ncbi:ABC-F family ATP-binding cassette domain-containing protein [Brucella sp. IR073]|uniref:ABC-F family ATP-binding cassette domain-containing protein n=1 Tax=unclassified Brucella TaxID=2632610 RepID=UPI003B983B06